MTAFSDAICEGDFCEHDDFDDCDGCCPDCGAHFSEDHALDCADDDEDNDDTND